MNDAVDAAVEAQREYLNRSMHDRACYVQAIRDVVLDQENLKYISRLAVEETGMGGYEYKLIKNRLAAVKTPGIEDLTTDAMSGDDGLTLPWMAMGAVGLVSVTAHVAPNLFRALIDAVVAQDLVEAQRLHLELAPIVRAHHGSRPRLRGRQGDSRLAGRAGPADRSPAARALRTGGAGRHARGPDDLQPCPHPEKRINFYSASFIRPG